MDRLNYGQLTALLRKQGLTPEPYSGRGMYGRECVAVKFREGEHAGDYTLPTGWTTDQLGKGLIFYWPHTPWQAS